MIAGTPAASAGLAGGDVTTALDGQAISSASALTAVMELHHPGDRVQITWQDTAGSQHTATVRFAGGPAD